MQSIIAPSTYLPPMAPLDITMAMERTELGKALLELVEQHAARHHHRPLRERPRPGLHALPRVHVGPGSPRDGARPVRPPLPRSVDEQVLLPGRLAQVRRARWRGSSSGRAAPSWTPPRSTRSCSRTARSAGVELWEGRTLYSDAVISTLDPHTTFLDLVGGENLPAELKESVDGLEARQVELQHPARRLGRSAALPAEGPAGQRTPS